MKDIKYFEGSCDGGVKVEKTDKFYYISENAEFLYDIVKSKVKPNNNLNVDRIYICDINKIDNPKSESIFLSMFMVKFIVYDKRNVNKYYTQYTFFHKYINKTNNNHYTRIDSLYRSIKLRKLSELQ